MKTQDRPGPIPGRGNELAVMLEQLGNVNGGIECLVGSLPDAVDKELEPRFPGAPLPHFLKEAAIVSPVLFEEQAEIKKRFVQRALRTQVQSDEEAPEASIAVQGRVDVATPV